MHYWRKNVGERMLGELPCVLLYIDVDVYVCAIIYTALCTNEIDVEILCHTVSCGAYCQTNSVRFSFGEIAFSCFFSCLALLDDLRIENLVLNIDKKLWVYGKYKIVSYIWLKCSYICYLTHGYFRFLFVHL